jgi:hydroxyacylglutathione hydrolase
MLITKHIHMLNIPFSIPVAPGVTIGRAVNIFPIETGKRLCLVDAGVAGSERAILSYVKSLGHRPDHIRTLILTHAHPDHVGAARAIRDATGCRVMAHWGDRRWIEDTDMQERERPVPGFRTLVAGPVAVDRVLADGETIDLGRFLVAPFHTPGHSRGSLSLYIRSDRALITGDAVPVPGEPPIYEDAANSRMS